jgi:phosphopantetheine adenylyltransferase
MSRQDNRVLARTGARELSIEEVDQVSAAMGHTNVCTAIMATATATGSGDGDGCSDSDRDSSFI